MTSELTIKLDHGIWRFYRNALGAFLFQPTQWGRILRLIGVQRRAARRRRAAEMGGEHIPPYLIISVTRQCNLHCKGCYFRAQHRDQAAGELTVEEWADILAQAAALGVGTVIVAGGEPFIKPGLLELLGRFPDMVFAVFTNGMLLTEEAAQTIKTMPHVVPVISLEGHGESTDGRRGPGVYRAVMEGMERLHARGILYGVSHTVTTGNLDTITSRGYVRELKWNGCRLIFYIEYVPFEEGTENLELDEEGRAVLLRRIARVGRTEQVLAVAFPGDEESFGGCLAAGRGFLHVGADGAVEPCPFSPFSNLNLRDVSFQEALQSDFLKAVRETGDMLDETSGGCALFRNRDRVEALLAQAAAPNTGNDMNAGSYPAGPVTRSIDCATIEKHRTAR